MIAKRLPFASPVATRSVQTVESQLQGLRIANLVLMQDAIVRQPIFGQNPRIAFQLHWAMSLQRVAGTY